MGRFMKFGRRNNSTITYTKNEPYAICFYLFNLFEEKSNLNVIEDNDEAIRLFLENTDRLNKNERLKAVLKAEISRLEKQNIRDAFEEEAERSDAILLFDKADTFFYNRNQAEHTWERSLVNEFLTQMEEFTGILICTINLRNIIDPAMQRRFHMHVEFKPMKLDGIKIMFEKYFLAYHLKRA